MTIADIDTHDMNDGNNICRRCGAPRHQIIVSPDLPCQGAVETEDHHDADLKIEMED